MFSKWQLNALWQERPILVIHIQVTKALGNFRIERFKSMYIIKYSISLTMHTFKRVPTPIHSRDLVSIILKYKRHLGINKSLR